MTAPGVIVVRLAAPLFFANGGVFADAVKRAVDAADATGNGPVRHVVIDLEAVTDVDVTGAESFQALLEWLERREIGVALSRVRPGIRQRLVALGVPRPPDVYETNRAAIAALASTRTEDGT